MQSCQWSFGYTTTRQQSLSMRCLSFRCVVVGEFPVCAQCMHNWLMPVNNIHGRMSPKRFFPLFGTLFASVCSFFWWRVFVNRCIRTKWQTTHTHTVCQQMTLITCLHNIICIRILAEAPPLPLLPAAPVQGRSCPMLRAQSAVAYTDWAALELAPLSSRTPGPPEGHHV